MEFSEQGDRGITVATQTKTDSSPPPTEVSSRAKRRTFTVAYKLDIIARADACTEPGKVGELLRGEALYSSYLSDWRKEHSLGLLSSMAPGRRGPKPAPRDPHSDKIADLEKQLAQALARAEHAEAIVDLQKKVASLLGRPFSTPSERP